ncbi:MerR family transcriptional regulator [Enterococcus faecalis]|nr:MerR family transcriptional regulator [Enterococcus faecalis]
MKTVKEMSKLTGVSVRTIQYYDKIGLLKPSDKTELGYRQYSDNKLFQLQQILFYKEMGLSLKEIQKIMSQVPFNSTKELVRQKFLLSEKKKKIETMIGQINLLLEGELDMNFEAYKKTLATKIPEDTSTKEREAILNAITPEQLDTIKEAWGMDKFFDFLNHDSTFRKNIDSYMHKETKIIHRLLNSSNQVEQNQIIMEWMTLVSKVSNDTKKDLKTVTTSMKESYKSSQLTINYVNTKFGVNTSQKLFNLLSNYEQTLAKQ